MLVVAVVLMIATGYLVSLAILPGTTLQPVVRLLMSLALSLLLTILGGFVLHSTPMGITLWSLLAWYCIWSVVGYFVARLVHHPAATPHPLRRAIRLDWRDVTSVAFACIIVTVAFGISAQSAQREYATPYSQFWMLPATAENAQVVHIGAENHEGQMASYRIELRQAGTVLFESGPFSLLPGETRELRVPLPSHPGNAGAIEAYLYSPASADHAYRYVAIWPGAPGK